jgi:hypothetical protein
MEMAQKHSSDPEESKLRKPETTDQFENEPVGASPDKYGLTLLQQQIGNRAVQRLIAQRAGDGSFELDEATQARINRERGGGQPLDDAAQTSMSEALGQDLSAVRVHTSPEADSLNSDLGAKAFATGKDIFFSKGAYEPHSTGGQELLAHELTHVAQQSSGVVGGGSRMTVNAPGDVYEQEADAVAKTVMSRNTASGIEIQRQAVPEEEEEQVQLQVDEEEEEEELTA